jgi:hypothetical protein
MIKKEPIIVAGLITVVFICSWFQLQPAKSLLDWKATKKANASIENTYSYQVYDYSNGESPIITVDILKREHFWNPQVAIWLEDTTGKYLETLLVTTSTAKGLFYGGRSASNFRDFDGKKITEENASIRRVNALPHWAYKRNIKAEDGEMVPHPNNPLVDGITGATPTDNFFFKSKSNNQLSIPSDFVIKVEVNVAFDQNEYYSEYDYLDDEVFHSGIGLLGQPSLIYQAKISSKNQSPYYLMELIGHGHHSAQNGEIYYDMSTITTARYILERIVVKVNYQ